MTGIFDFVRFVTTFGADNDFADIVEDVLKEAITKNTSKNFRAWFERVRWGCEVVPVEEIYMNFDIDDLDHFYSDFHDLDHAHHHRVWCDRSYKILYQFEKFFRGAYDKLEREEIVFEKEFRTLRKHVESFKDYLDRFYVKNNFGSYRLKEEFRT